MLLAILLLLCVLILMVAYLFLVVNSMGKVLRITFNSEFMKYDQVIKKADQLIAANKKLLGRQDE